MQTNKARKGASRLPCFLPFIPDTLVNETKLVYFVFIKTFKMEEISQGFLRELISYYEST